MYMDRIKEQFERVKRWHKRLEEISTDKEHAHESDYYQDILYAFFQNLWSLRDWIINSGSLNREIVDNYFHTNTDMKICRDLANGSKHLIINSPALDRNISINKREYYSRFLGGEPVQIETVYWVHAKGYPPLNAFVLATTCLVVCEAFLRKNGLLE